MTTHRLFLFAFMAISFALCADANEIEYGRDVRPILSDACYHCHGFDEQTRQADLRLDIQAGLFSKTESDVTPIVPKNLADSAMIARILSTEASEVMPPPDHPRQLTEEQKKTLQRWVEQGAPFEEKHWAFVPIKAPSLPNDPAGAAWAKQTLDRFVHAKFAELGLTPSAEADRATLIRRLSFDLIGLPPTPEEVAAFENDTSVNAYEKVVDRLLSSPKFGERMAVDWLDIARYADTAGFQVDPPRDMWPWRDWVVRAFNDNIPYDQFTVWQLAGDLLPNPTQDQIIATGFNRNHRMNGEAGSIEAEWHVENIVDRVDTTATTWLGLTMGCARCHDHKYDPVTMHDFYGMFAFFNNVDERGLFTARAKEKGMPILQLPTAADQKRIAVLEDRLEKAKSKLAAVVKEHGPKAIAWAETALADHPKWTTLVPQNVESESGVKFTIREDGSVLASVDGPLPRTDTYTIDYQVTIDSVSAVRLELIPDPSLPQGGSAVHLGQKIILSGFDAFFDGSDSRVPFSTASASYEQPGYNLLALAEGKKVGSGAGAWSISSRTRDLQIGVFELAKPLAKEATGKTLSIKIEQKGAARAMVGCFRISVTDHHFPGFFNDELRKAIATTTDNRDARQNNLVRATYLKSVPEWNAANAEVQRLIVGLNEAKDSLPSVMVMNEAKPRDTFMLMRGAYDKPGEKVEAAVPAALHELPEDAPRNRLGLAQWIISPDNPLTARVTVNRYWAMLFGKGIVTSLENFGVQGDWPSNRALLDWIAEDFRQTWNVKRLLKTFVMSSTYRQRSHISPELLAADPENVYLARGPRFRLPAEMIRDQALFTSGLLIDQAGGRPVKPYQPEGLWEQLSVTGLKYPQGKGHDLYRRSLYTYWKRTFAPTTLSVFDAPTRESCTVKRGRTTTPMQALALMNDVTYIEASRVLATKLLNDGSCVTDTERIRRVSQIMLSRDPRDPEMSIYQAALHRYTKRFSDNPEATAAFIKIGDTSQDDKLPPERTAAWTMLVNLIMNLDEAVTKQ